MTEETITYNAPPMTALDYPRLAEWLEHHNARRLWRAPANDRYIEAWQLRGGRGVLIEIHPGGRGWDIWSNDDTLDAAATFAAVEKRYGLDSGSGR